MVVYLVIGLVWALFRQFLIVPKKMLSQELLSIVENIKIEYGETVGNKAVNLVVVLLFLIDLLAWPLVILFMFIKTIFK